MKFALLTVGLSMLSVPALHADIISGNATYSNFFVGNTQVNTATSTVGTASVITFTPAGPSSVWTGTGTGSGSQIMYDVAFTTPITAIGLSFIGTATGPTAFSAIDSVGETITLHFAPTTTYPMGFLDLTISDVYLAADGSGKTSEILTLPFPVTSVSILKSVDIAQNGGVGAISSVTNTYYTSVPEPASLGLLSIGGLLLTRRRA